MSFIGDDQVRLIKTRIDLVQLMGEYTPLRKSGGNFTGCCAFHQERTPSMYVYVEQQAYHCFGCGAHGDAITLIREKEHLEFSDAVEFLARRAGITITYQNTGKNQMARGEREDLMKVVEFATGFYERQLWETPEAAEARDYLASRHLTQAACKRFRVGWSPGRGRLIDEARRNGLPVKALLATDLAVDRDGRSVDRFFERVMFPICDRFGQPIAFSGRLLPAAERKAKEEGRGVGKYVNNTDTPLYHKGGTVFNLHRARTVSRDRGRLIVMEGPTDVMAADEAGYQECVAVLGTALTPDHAKQLGNLVGATGRLIILLDGDRAGQANSLKAIRTCLQAGVPVRVAMLPDELDPAELLGNPAERERGRQVMEQVLGGARADIDHLLRTLAPRPFELDNRAKVAVTDQMLDAVRPMPDAELRALHLRDIADWLGIERVRLEKRLAGEGKTAPTADNDAADGEVPIATLSPAQDLLLHVLMQCPELRAPAADEHHLEASAFPEPWRDIASHLLMDHATDLHALSMLDVVQQHPSLHAAVYRWASSGLETRSSDATDASGAMARAIIDLRCNALTERTQKLKFNVAEAERARDFARIRELNQELSDIRKQLADLRGHSGFG
ncbi:MAG: DNA primase [Planctomycetes bacterium]|nr:DNA primase [Planctomycetota bacterium]